MHLWGRIGLWILWYPAKYLVNSKILIFHQIYSTFTYPEIFPLLESISYISLSFTFWCPISFSINATELKNFNQFYPYCQISGIRPDWIPIRYNQLSNTPNRITGWIPDSKQGCIQGYIFRFSIISPPPLQVIIFFSQPGRPRRPGLWPGRLRGGCKGGRCPPPRKFFEFSTWKDAFLRLLKEFWTKLQGYGSQR